MKGERPDYSVSTVIAADNGDRWREIGVAFTSEGGTITVLLDALPVSGKLVLRARLSRLHLTALVDRGAAQRGGLVKV